MAHISRLHWLPIAGLLATLTIAGAGWDQAEARSPRAASPRAIHGPNYRPPYAAIVLDDKTGQVLHEDHADEPRHPASLTKIMTLYLLFEQIEAGTFKLDTPLPISTQAAIQNPTKLGLKANQTIKVEDAIKGLVTKSANDAAVVITEALGGSEEEFAKLMTLKARMLGMTSTTYVNASGLPAVEQITTARDQALLGHAIQHRFPVYYQYFATPSFLWRGAEMRNHNNLLGQREGRRRHQDRLHRSLRLQPGLLGSPRRPAHRRGRPGRHLECGARYPHAPIDRSKYHSRFDAANGADRRRGAGTGRAPVTVMAPAPTFAPASAHQQARPADGAEAAGPGRKAAG